MTHHARYRLGTGARRILAALRRRAGLGADWLLMATTLFLLVFAMAAVAGSAREPLPAAVDSSHTTGMSRRGDQAPLPDKPSLVEGMMSGGVIEAGERGPVHVSAAPEVGRRSPGPGRWGEDPRGYLRDAGNWVYGQALKVAPIGDFAMFPDPSAATPVG
jgi:hypothetical protein